MSRDPQSSGGQSAGKKDDLDPAVPDETVEGHGIEEDNGDDDAELAITGTGTCNA